MSFLLVTRHLSFLFCWKNQHFTNSGGRGGWRATVPTQLTFPATPESGTSSPPIGTSLEGLGSRTGNTGGERWEAHFSLLGRLSGGGPNGAPLGQKQLWAWQQPWLPSAWKQVLGVELKNVCPVFINSEGRLSNPQ